VLEKQQSREYQRKLNELKAAGVPYEERIELLENVSYPKPLADEIYEVFNVYAATHPWVAGEGIRPKGVAREMAESFQSFSDYVKDLGLQRSEGVLLRYLSDVYRALVQNVPADQHTEPLQDLVAWLRATLAVVDSSLVTEWETLARGEDTPLAPETPRVADISLDRRAFAARVRAELHALVRALAQRDWQEAADSVRRGPDDPWGPSELEVALSPFLEAHGDIACDHRARLADRTEISAVGPHQWTVRQRLYAVPPPTDAHPWAQETDDDDDGATGWAIEGRIDLRADTNPEGPIVELVSVGG
jgi:hypothetical protein